MDKDHGLTAVEFVHQWVEFRIAEINTLRVGIQYDAIGVEVIKRVSGFSQRTVDVRQHQRSEEAKSTGVFGYNPRCKFIESSSHLSCFIQFTRLHTRLSYR